MSRSRQWRVQGRLVSAAVAVLTINSVGPFAAAAPRTQLQWSPCARVVTDWDGGEHTECATLLVPVDHRRPDGRKLELTLSRIPARSPERRRGVIVTNPGGPGISGLTLPDRLSAGTVARIGDEHDLIGFAPRGTGPSTAKACVGIPDDGPPVDPAAPPRRQFEQQYEREARRNSRCVGYDREFLANLSTNVIADDLDSIRVALGEDKIDYYGISWGTALGAVYRSKYDAHVGRMLLDSVMPPRFDLDLVNEGQAATKEWGFERFCGWLAERDDQYHFGATSERVAAGLRSLLAEGNNHVRVLLGAPEQYWAVAAAELVKVRHGEDAALGMRAPFGLIDTRGEFNQLQEQAVLCNDAGTDPDLAQSWRAAVRLRNRYPIFGSVAKYENRCVEWPLPQQRWQLRRGRSIVQLVGHTYESTTPYAWAEAMRQRIGGSLLTIRDDIHGSLSAVPCGSVAVEFFRTGRTSVGTCVDVT